MSILTQITFESGSLGEFPGGVQQYTSGRGKVVSGSRAGVGGPPSARFGTYYFESEVHSGDNIYGGERCEGVLPGYNIAVQGAEHWFAWSVWIPTSLPLGRQTGLIGGQFHSSWDYAQSNQFFVSPSYAGLPIGSAGNEHWAYGVSGGPAVTAYQGLNDTYSKAFDLGALSGFQGYWIDVKMHYIWSSNLDGTTEIWAKPSTSNSWTNLVSRVGNVANRYEGHDAYLKFGQNRIQSSGLGVGYAWYDGITIGTTEADVNVGGSGTSGGGVITPTLTTKSATSKVIRLNYTPNLNTGSAVSGADYAIKLNGATATITGVTVYGTYVAITVSETILSSTIILVDYTGTGLKSASGGTAATFSGITVPPPSSGGAPATPSAGPASTLWHVKHHLYETGALIADIRPENLQFNLNRQPPHTIQYELSLSRPEVADDFVGPYRTTFSLWYGDIELMAGPHTTMDVGYGDDHCTVYGKDWFHLLERTQYPFDPRPSPEFTPSRINDYVIGSPAQGFAYETASADVTDIMVAVFDKAVGGVPKHFQFIYPTLAANLGIPTHFSLGLADSTTLAAIIQQLADIYPGFVYEMLPNRELRVYSPHKYSEDAGNLSLTIAERKAACNYVIDSANDKGIEELHFANIGPGATHLFGKGPGMNQSNYGSALGYADAQRIYGRLDDTYDVTEVANRDVVIARTRKRFSEVVNPQHEITLKMNPDRIANFWTLFQPGYALWIDVDLIAHQIQSAQEIVQMNCTVNNEGDASVDFGFEQIYAGTVGVAEG